MRDSFERNFSLFLRKESNSLLSKIAKGLLRILSWLYKAAIALRNWAFNNGWLTSYYPPIPIVISVGNIVAGGTGKTPFTSLLAQEFSEVVRVAILSRGYRAAAEQLEKPFFLSKGEGPLFPPSYGGDEPYLLASHAPKAFVVVGSDRALSARLAAKAGVALAIIDDGMQHRWLYRDYEIAIVNGQEPFGLNYFLPRGFLREAPSSLKRADLIILTHTSRSDKDRLIQLMSFYSEAPVLVANYAVKGIYSLKGEEIASLEGKSVAVFCGIANPANFMATVKSLGMNITAQLILSDHGAPTANSMVKFVEEAQALGAEWVVCTEKDKVKIKEDLSLPLPVVWVKIALEMEEESVPLWNAFLEEIKNRLDCRLFERE